jgi:hypothetical protein
MNLDRRSNDLFRQHVESLSVSIHAAEDLQIASRCGLHGVFLRDLCDLSDLRGY